MKKRSRRSISLMLGLVFAISSFTSCAETSASQKNLSEGTQSITFDEIYKHESDWLKTYTEAIKPNVDNAVLGISEEYSERLKALSIIYEGSTIKEDLATQTNLTNIKFTESLIVALLNNDWNPATVDILLGKYDSVFRMSRQYFIAGINVKIINNKITNIVFNEKYTGQICDSISMKSTQSEIVKLLGQPDFENESAQLFGYKTDRLYLFFTGSQKITEISIYPRDTDYDKNALVAAMNAFQKDQNLSFAELLKASWPDYEFNPGYSSLEYVGYSARGILVKFDDADKSLKIDVFSNFIGNITENVSLPDNFNDLAGFDQTVFSLHPDRDSIFCCEQYRILMNNKIRGESTDSDYNLGMAFGTTNQASVSPDKNQAAYSKPATADDGGYACVYILSLTHQKPDVELGATINTQLKWIGATYLYISGNLSASDSSDKISYIYDTQNNRMIPLPNDIFGDDCEIVSVKKNAVIYRKT